MSVPVAIVGAGPGDPGLLTVRARALLDRADAVVHDALVAPELLATVPGEHFDVGKRRGRHLAEQEEIHRLLIELYRQGRRVVRLKGGDPLLFGRGAEEMEALRQAGVPYELVPGVSSAIAGPGLAGIPVTHRELSASLTIVTGHECAEPSRDPLRWRALAEVGHTLVILMGLSHLERICAQLIEGGRSPDTPAAAVQEAGTPRQRVVVGCLGDLPARVRDAGLRAPAVVVVGAVAALAEVR